MLFRRARMMICFAPDRCWYQFEVSPRVTSREQSTRLEANVVSRFEDVSEEVESEETKDSRAESSLESAVTCQVLSDGG